MKYTDEHYIRKVSQLPNGGTEFSNYLELCEYFELVPTKGQQRERHFKQLSRFVDIERTGRRITVTPLQAYIPKKTISTNYQAVQSILLYHLKDNTLTAKKTPFMKMCGYDIEPVINTANRFETKAIAKHLDKFDLESWERQDMEKMLNRCKLSKLKQATGKFVSLQRALNALQKKKIIQWERKEFYYIAEVDKHTEHPPITGNNKLKEVVSAVINDKPKCKLDFKTGQQFPLTDTDKARFESLKQEIKTFMKTDFKHYPDFNALSSEVYNRYQWESGIYNMGAEISITIPPNYTNKKVLAAEYNKALKHQQQQFLKQLKKSIVEQYECWLKILTYYQAFEKIRPEYEEILQTILIDTCGDILKQYTKKSITWEFITS